MTVNDNTTEPNWEALTDDELEQLEAKELDTKDRKSLGTGTFAFPRLRKLPLNDAAHVRNAMARFGQTKGWTSGEKASAKSKIIRYARKYGIEVGDFGKVSASADPWTLTVSAKSLDMPTVAGHPNRMPFSGILTKVGLPSDKPPNGSDGKRVLLTRECCEDALDSLLGMGVDLAFDMKGHDVQSKVGVITSAYIDGDDLMIAGFLYSADFPKEALKIHLNQADLGFSFEAQNLAVESLDADPLVVKSCVFTGAAILMKDAAAYQTTALAASKAKEHEVEEIQKAVSDALSAALATALGPITQQITDLAASQTSLTSSVEDLKKSPTVTANALMCSKMEPLALSLDALAEQMEQSGAGLHPSRGHVVHARKMAAAIRADAANGRVPHEFADGGTYSAVQASTVKVEETPEYKALASKLDDVKAQAAKDIADADKKAVDAEAALDTKLKDMKASIDRLTPAPERKTLTPQITALLSKVGIEAPEEGKSIQVGKLDEALKASGLDTGARLRLKTNLRQAGIIDMNGAV